MAPPCEPCLRNVVICPAIPCFSSPCRSCRRSSRVERRPSSRSCARRRHSRSAASRASCSQAWRARLLPPPSPDARALSWALRAASASSGGAQRRAAPPGSPLLPGGLSRQAARRAHARGARARRAPRLPLRGPGLPLSSSSSARRWASVSSMHIRLPPSIWMILVTDLPAHLARRIHRRWHIAPSCDLLLQGAASTRTRTTVMFLVHGSPFRFRRRAAPELRELTSKRRIRAARPARCDKNPASAAMPRCSLA